MALTEEDTRWIEETMESLNKMLKDLRSGAAS